MSGETFDTWKALESWRSEHYSDEKVQNIFYTVAINYQVQRAGGALTKLISDGTPKDDSGGSDFIKRHKVLDYYSIISRRARELIGFDWVAELEPLALEIEKYAAHLEKIVSKAWQAGSSIQLDLLTSDLNPKLAYMRDCVDAYVNPLDPPTERGCGLRPKTRTESISPDSARELVRSAQWLIKQRRNELDETLGFVIKTYHEEQEYRKYFNFTRHKRKKYPEPLFHPRIGDVEAKLEIIKCVSRYLNLPGMQCRAATDRFLLAVLDTEFIPLNLAVRAFRRL